MSSNRLVRLAAAVAAPLLVTGVVIAQAGMASADVGRHGDHDVLYVSKSANPSNDDRGCDSAAFSTIQSAVNAAPKRGTVVVCGGTYNEQVVVPKPLSLEGKRGATIDETGVNPTLQVTVPGVGTLTIFAGVVIVSSHVEFAGFRVTNAMGEGVLAAGVTGDLYDVEIEHNAVVHNDLGGGVPPASPYFECAPAGPIPGDCGEGVHFIAVADSHIKGNYIAGNSGGVLLTDETGPTHGNVIENNVVTGNASDCGITVPGHNPNAISAAGQLQPSVAGVYDNLIKENVVTGNGLLGEGAGVLFANAGPGTASYDNRVEDNFIAGNGLSGVTMHAHTIPPSSPNQFEDLNGNTIVGNVIGTNNKKGDTLDGPPVTDPSTTGVLVFSGGISVTLRIAHNTIFNNHFGIWLSKVVMASGLRTNKFANVDVHISGGH